MSSNYFLTRHLLNQNPRYLEEDPTTVVLERHGRVSGYELYIVEQWACSRIHPTFVIATYTGDPSHSVLVGILAVPADENTWSDRLRVYYKAVAQYHARLRDTPLGSMMVTNLSSFPSALTVIPVPDGDVKKHREDFIVNENLKRLGCSGRAGLSLANPPGATAAKFHQLYRTSERISLYASVIELVKLCQVALVMFDKLAQEYADGLLCDFTEKAINDWWTETGSEFYNTEPSDGVLGPTTVAALLGMMMGARNRLNYVGAPVAKDVFEIASFKRGIGNFQKQHKLERTRRLDRETLTCLHRVTAKAAAGEGWAVPKAVKSTVVELSGKGGEMVMGIVGSRDKGGIGDIETLDIDRFVSLVTGERSKWLWHGKSKRSNVTNDAFGQPLPDVGNMLFGRDDQGGYLWTTKGLDTVVHDMADTRRNGEDSIYSARPPGSAISIGAESPVERDKDKDKELQLRRTVLKNVTHKMNDARSGFGRIKDAVGFRGHANKQSKDDPGEVDDSYAPFSSSASLGPNSAVPNSAMPNSAVPNSAVSNSALPLSPGTSGVPKAFTWKNKPEEYQNGFPKEPLKEKSIATAISNVSDRLLNSTPFSPQSNGSAPTNSSITTFPPPDILSPEDNVVLKKEAEEEKWAAQSKDIRRELVMSDPSVAGSFDDIVADLAGPCLESYRNPDDSSNLLRRRHSVATCPILKHTRNDAWLPRRLSFSDAEDAVLGWEGIGILDHPTEQDVSIEIETNDPDNYIALSKQNLLAEELTNLYTTLTTLKTSLSPFLKTHLRHVENLETVLSTARESTISELYTHEHAYEQILEINRTVLEEQRGILGEAMAGLEIAGKKLEYEVDALGGKVGDVEEAVDGFERLVAEVEGKMGEVERLLSGEGWGSWAWRCVTGADRRVSRR